MIAIGTELAEVDLWRDQLGHSASLVRVDIDPEVLADQHRADIQVLSDGAAFVTALSRALDRQNVRQHRAGTAPKSPRPGRICAR